jgi:hypothetical protein
MTARSSTKPPAPSRGAQGKERRTMIDGFLALYIFMLAAFTGNEIIGACR